MKPVLSRAQMRDYDKYAIETCHVPGLVLMENAGRGAADVVSGLLALRGARVVVVCGAGNNGGDGFVVARHLLARGAETHVFLCGSSEMVMGDARINHDAYIDLGGRFTQLGEAGDFGPLEQALAAAQVIVDAVFGTGLRKPVETHVARVIDAMNGAPGLRVALDLPSGLDADTGAPLGTTLQAHHTVTFGHLKIGLLTPEGARLAGRVHVVDLGVPHAIVAHTGHVAEVVDPPSVAAWLRPRETNTYKHQAGNVVVLAGSPGKVGAALLACEGALRAGAGLVTVATWPESAPALEGHAREFMTARLDPARLVESIEDVLRHRQVAVVGPGFGLGELAGRAVDHVVFSWDGVKVVDADAITRFAGRPEALIQARGQVILTPHTGELGRLLGASAAEVERDRFGAAREVARRTHAIVLLKGARTLVATQDTMLINTTGNPALATAGSGDVLSGIIGALACTMPAERAAATGAFVHGLAADAWSQAHGGADRGMLASEIAAGVPAVLAGLLRSRAG